MELLDDGKVRIVPELREDTTAKLVEVEDRAKPQRSRSWSTLSRT
jgi:hypothetical protein